MSKSKKSVSNLQDYESLKNNLIENCQKSIETVTELNSLIINTLKPVDTNSKINPDLENELDEYI